MIGPLALFVFSLSVTPGPNNIMLLSSGINFGYQRTLPHMAGILFGMVLMLCLAGVGFSAVLQSAPWAYQTLKAVGLVYLLYLAWRIGSASAVSESRESGGSPFSFFEAMIFQWVNPKAWVISTTMISLYTTGESILLEMSMVLLVFMLVCFPAISFWVIFGGWLRKILNSPARVRIFNTVMAVLLVLSLIPVFVKI
ncbi:MAG: LysE family translocator [Deltaproteobacteria bacterium]|nr:LysE family translocator [Deltaproteobacteria bacterium]